MLIEKSLLVGNSHQSIVSDPWIILKSKLFSLFKVKVEVEVEALVSVSLLKSTNWVLVFLTFNTTPCGWVFVFCFLNIDDVWLGFCFLNIQYDAVVVSWRRLAFYVFNFVVFFWVIFVFGNRNKGILSLSWGFIKGNSIFSNITGINLQKIKMSRSNLAEIKKKVIFCRNKKEGDFLQKSDKSGFFYIIIPNNNKIIQLQCIIMQIPQIILK